MTIAILKRFIQKDMQISQIVKLLEVVGFFQVVINVRNAEINVA